MNGFFEFSIHDKHWGEIKVLRAIPQENESWGVLSLLKGTVWENLIHVVSGESLSHALHGRVIPFLEELGGKPTQLLRRVAKKGTACKLSVSRICSMRTDKCVPCTETPPCYEAPESDPKIASLLYGVVMACKDDRYVIAVEGDEFSY